MVLTTVSSLEEFQLSIKGKAVLFFWANWHEASQPSGSLPTIIGALSEKYSGLNFYSIEAENFPVISSKFQVSVVPTFVISVGEIFIDKYEGVNPADISALVRKLVNLSENEIQCLESTEKDKQQAELYAKLGKLINSAPVMLFMKGSPTTPKCGFSRKIVELLQKEKVPFASFDILSDDEVRQGLKTFSDWPTYPQLYVRGTLIGGLDIVTEMAEAGNLRNELNITDLIPPPTIEPIEARLKKLVNKAPVMLFMKGSPSTPRCGFSRTIVELLQKEGISFDSFDILSDDEVRQGLKTFSDWPTYPQLYVRGTLIGGLDIVKEMAEAGDLKTQLEL